MINLFLGIFISTVFLASVFLFQNILFPLIILSFLLALSFIFYPENGSFVDRLRTRIITYLKKDYHYVVIIAAVLIFFYLHDLIGFNASLIAGFFILVYFLNLDERAAFVTALFFLAACPFILILPDSELAEKSAVLAFYFLVIGVIWQFINLIRQEKEVEEIKRPTFISKHLVFRRILNKKQTFSYLNNFFIFLTSFCISAILVLLSYSFINRYQKAQNIAISPTPVAARPIATPSTEPIKPILVVLNGSGIAGQAASASAFLKKIGWEDRLNIKIDNADRNNYNGMKLKYFLKYQTIAKELSSAILKMEGLNKQQINLESFSEATVSGDLILIIGR